MAGRGRIPAPIPQFNPREERQSLWRGETTRTLSRPTPPLQFRSRAAAPSEGAGRGVPRGPHSFLQRRARAHTQRRCPLTPRTAHHTPLVAVLQSAARARCTGPTCGRRHVRRGSPRGSAPTTSNAPPWHRGADDQAQRMTPGKRSRASTIAAGRRAAPNHGGRAAAARNLRHNANRARPSTGKHTPRLGHSVPRARERGWLLAREESFRDPLQDHARIIPRPGGRRDCNQSSRAACRSLGRLGRRGGEQGTQL